MEINSQNIIDTLKKVRYPGNGKSLIENEMVQDIIIEDNKI